MPALVRRLLDRLSQRVDRIAAGTPVPAGLEPPEPGERQKPTAHERALMRRRLRALDPADGEARALKEALDQDRTLDELVASGVVRGCPSCAELVSPREGHCWSCGTALGQVHSPRSTDHGPSPKPVPTTRVGSPAAD